MTTIALCLYACSNAAGGGVVPRSDVDATFDTTVEDTAGNDGGITENSDTTDATAQDASGEPVDAETDATVGADAGEDTEDPATDAVEDVPPDAATTDTMQPDAPDPERECDEPSPVSECQTCECVDGDWQCVPAYEGMACDGSLVCSAFFCAAGQCEETGPVDCQDGFACTTDTCSEDGGCSNVIAADSCIIGNACFRAGDIAPRSCGACIPELSATEWSPYERCSYAVDFELQNTGFDVSNDGRVTVAGWAEGVLTAHCLDELGGEVANVTLFARDETRVSSNGAAYVGRAGETGQSVVLAMLPGTTDGNETSLLAWWLDDECNLVTGPTLLPGLDGTGSTGDLEYMDLAMGDQGQTALIYQSQLAIDYSPTLALYDGEGRSVGNAQSLGLRDCSDRTYGVQLAMNETNGNVVASCQGHQSDPIMARRFDAGGVVIDTEMFDASAGLGRSWYDSHALGMSDDGSFVLVWQDNQAQTLRGAFYAADGALLTTVALASGDGRWHDGYRRIHAEISILPDGSYLIPGTQRTDSTRAFFVYTTAGELVAQVPLSSDSPGLRTDAEGLIYAMDTSGTLVRGLGPFAWTPPAGAE